MLGGEEGGSADAIFIGLAEDIFPDRFANSTRPADTPAP